MTKYKITFDTDAASAPESWQDCSRDYVEEAHRGGLKAETDVNAKPKGRCTFNEAEQISGKETSSSRLDAEPVRNSHGIPGKRTCRRQFS